MATIKYFIRSNKKSETANIRIRFSVRRGSEFYAVTPFVVPVNLWDEKKQTIKKGAKLDLSFTHEAAQLIVDNLQSLEKEIFSRYNIINGDIEKDWLQTVVDNFLNPPTMEEDKPITFFDFIQKNFIEEADQRRGKKGDKVTTGTIKQYSNAFMHLKEFCRYKGREYDFGDINEDFVRDYTSFRELQFAAKNSIGKDLKQFRVFLRLADVKSTKLNIELDSEFKTVKPIKEDVDNIALTEEELEDLTRMRLHNHPHFDRIRDQFVILCRTACRYSDLDKINKLVEDGLFKMKQEKTGTEVYIPIHPDVQRIIDKYNGNLPRVISNQKFNEALKIVCSAIWRMRKQNFSQTKTVGGKVSIENRPRYKWVSSHTGRRTFATTEYNAGTDIFVIMAITGHKSQESFFKYIKVSQKEHAKKMLTLWNDRIKSKS